MNRHARRAAAAQGRTPDASQIIRDVYAYLANEAAPTVTGCTLILPDGSVRYLSADDARALHGNAKGEVAQ